MSTPAATLATGIRTECITDAYRLAALREAWVALLDRCASDNPFVMPEWVLPWWETFGEHHELATVAVWDGDTLLGLALLMTSPDTHARLPAIVLRFIGTPLADRMEVLAAPGYETEVAAALVETLATGVFRWDVCSLREMMDTSPMLPALRAAANACGWTQHEWTCAYVPVMRVERTYAELQEQLGRNLRNQLNNRRNRLHARGTVAFTRRVVTPDTLAVDLDTIVAVEQASWKGAAGVGIFSTDAQRRFFRAALPAMAGAGRVDLATLTVDGALACYHLGFRVRGRYYSYNHAYDPAWADASPGLLLMEHVIRDSADHTDVHVLDASRSMRNKPHLLARWSGDAHTHVELTLYPPTLYARSLRMLHVTIAPKVRAWRTSRAPAESTPA